MKIPLKRKEPWEIVLNSLREGNIIDTGIFKLGLTADNDIVIIMTDQDGKPKIDEEGNCVVVNGSLTFGYFTKICNDIPEDKIMSIASDMALNKYIEKN